MLFSCPVKCEMSPFHPISGTSPFPLCVLEKTCWPGQAVLCGPRPGLVTNNRAKGLAPVSSSLRSDQKSFALIFFFFFFYSHVWQLISQYQEPQERFQIRKLPLQALASLLSPLSSPIASCSWVEEVWICSRLRALHQWFYLSTSCPLLLCLDLALLTTTRLSQRKQLGAGGEGKEGAM